MPRFWLRMNFVVMKQKLWQTSQLINLMDLQSLWCHIFINWWVTLSVQLVQLLTNAITFILRYKYSFLMKSQWIRSHWHLTKTLKLIEVTDGKHPTPNVDMGMLHQLINPVNQVIRLKKRVINQRLNQLINPMSWSKLPFQPFCPLFMSRTIEHKNSEKLHIFFWYGNKRFLKM